MKLQKKIEQNFTTVHNGFIKDANLGIAEKGLLLYMLHLPDNWDFSIIGLAKILGEGKCKIASTLCKLERAGYLRRTRATDEKGRVTDWVYSFSDERQEEWVNDVSDDEQNDNDSAAHKNTHKTDYSENRCSCEEKPHTDFRHLEKPVLENRAQINTKEINTIVINNQSSSDADGTIEETEYSETIDSVSEQVGREVLIDDLGYSAEQVDRIINVIADVMCTKKSHCRIGGEQISTSLVRDKFKQIYYEHIDYVLSSIRRYSSGIKNVRAYLLTSLYNSLTGLELQYDVMCGT